ncbi:MAG: hypothetical protein QMD65_01325 [Patescibacteria group bacterium]|nr:hypothetical protein [Patescibacteria group bacterium]
MIHEFFAVTITSIYQVHDTADNGLPLVQKIAADKDSVVSLGQKLETGAMVAITKLLITYIPEGGGLTSFERRIEMVNSGYFCGNTSYIVALFKTAEEAQECFKNKDRKPCDSRWITQTKAILKEIGDDHPVFYVCKDLRFGLLS